MLCSSHDVVDIEDSGTPAVLLCTDVFLATGLAHAEGLGRPDLAIVAIPNPLSGSSEDEVRSRARGAIEAITQALTK